MADNEQRTLPLAGVPAPAGGPPPPQVIAMQAYIRMVNDMSKDLGDKPKPEQISEYMRKATITAIECACRAQRHADALLVGVIGDKRMDLTERTFASYVADVLSGARAPDESLGNIAGLLRVP